MIYESNGLYYLKKGSRYEIANIDIKYNRTKKSNVLVVTGSGNYVNSIEEPVIYSFKELENKLCKSIK